ncbi:MAG: SsrA-binding protein, partial [Candidatus Omnitrophota bacterium]
MSNTIVTNRKAFRDYIVLETFECGIELRGSE